MGEIEVPYPYGRAFEIIQELNSKNDISDILEIGCHDCSFVEFLRQQGYNVIGIDKKLPESAKPLIGQGYVVEGDATYLSQYIGDKLFDLILANRIMSRGSTCAGLIQDGFLPSVIETLGSGRHPWSYDESAEIVKTLLDVSGDINCEAILENSYKHLKPEKFFVVCETGGDTLWFPQETVKNYGYKVLRFENQEAVLQK